MRAEYQILVIPYIRNSIGNIQYVVFKRLDLNIWQFIAGGGEENEKPIDAAKREAKEEANISSHKICHLKTTTSIPISCFKEHKNKKKLYVVLEYCFGIEIQNRNLHLSNEHTEYKFVNYEEAVSLLKYDGNKTALWEIHERIRENDLELG